MSFGDMLGIGFVLLVLYLIFRLILFEFLTFAFRRTPAIRLKLQRLNANGYLLRETSSRLLFATWMHAVGDGLQRLTGRGFFRSITFALVAGAVMWLTTLPISRINGGGASEYAEIESKLNDPRVTTEAAEALCLYENALVEIQRQTGRPVFLIPKSFSLYPVSLAQDSYLELVTTNEPGSVSLIQFMDGRNLIADVADLPDSVRNDPVSAARIAKSSRDGHLTTDLAKLAPESPKNKKLVENLISFCRSDRTVSDNVGNAALNYNSYRPRADYDKLVGLAVDRAIIFLHNEGSRDAWEYYQYQIAINQITLSLLFSIGAGFLILIATKFSIWVTRLLWTKLWVILNFLICIALGLTVSMVALFSLSIWSNTSRTLNPLAAMIAIAYSGDKHTEADHREHLYFVIGQGVLLKEHTCADIGQRSPLFVACDFLDEYFRPWNSETHQFDYEVLIPTTTDALTPEERGEKLASDLIRKSPLAILFLQAALPDKPELEQSVSLWNGFDRSPIAYVLMAPALIVAGLSFLFLFVLDLRKAVVKRVHRIVRDKRSRRF